ncbi:hypothetical protein L249_0307 [Ophiocordyceps polyrhachis-furcata BCC 54312]|uniref:Carrier domain-containing protein n=1 Tax=Ophiocordyceps polyrhachis-furcata BCC 54312 TaxID=1330021 RepID=A0A367LG35_9HYPO|nr:hypothetical protein L249_0307 [Ophiocordyceps polyrhachis-furcata BCC 54312]
MPPHIADASSNEASEDNAYSQQTTTIPLDVSKAVALCGRHQVTVESLFQTVWAIVISCYAGVEHVSYAYSAAGRQGVCRMRISAQSWLLKTVADAEARHGLGDLVPWGLHVVGTTDDDDDHQELDQYDVLARVLFKGAAVTIRSNRSVFQAANVAHTFVKVLDECVEADLKATVRDLDIFSQHDLDQVLRWNASPTEAVDTCFSRLFDTVARDFAHKPAVCSGDGNLTYGQLDGLSSTLACRLVAWGVREETPVLVCFDKGSAAIVSMLAIFKAGGAFVAVEPSWPAGRIEAVVEATRASIVLAQPGHCRLFDRLVRRIVGLDSKALLLLDHDGGGGACVGRQQLSPSRAAYVVFTSGSTGTPKGIVVQHRALCTAVLSLAGPMRVDSTSRFLQFAAYSFDVSYGDIFVTLSQGGCVCVPSEQERVDDLAGAMVRMKVNTACLIPSLAARIFRPEDVPCLETLVLGGEALMRDSLDVWAGKVSSLVQVYGPAEATIWCTAKTYRRADEPVNNVGRGLAALLWIVDVDNHHRLCPIGCVGELLIQGPVLARGYVDDEQTRQSFIDRPSWAAGPDRRFYKTGDLARYNPDGTVSFMGRKDTQVKLHGRRIELGEIEHHLSTHGLLRQSMVTLPTAGIYSQRLVAVMDRVQVKNLVDGLSSEGSPEAKGGGDDVSDAVEARLRTIWRLVLDREDMAADQSFVSLGGDSLSAMELVAACAADGFAVTKEDVLGSSIRQMASLMDSFLRPRFPHTLAEAVAEFWSFTGDGISSRHADFLLGCFPLLSVEGSPVSGSSLPAQPPWLDSDAVVKHRLKSIIADLVTSSDQQEVRPEHVFLYPKGMCAIGTLARELVPLDTQASEVVIFGWPYGSTPKCVRASGYQRFTFLPKGTSDELDALESRLVSGHSIACLFCEMPSNPLCATPDLHRIRRLADRHRFAVICDETIGTFVNVHVLPYADAVVTSLTKIFSGGCNVMGGSVVLNPQAPFYEPLRAKLNKVHHQHLIFPLDADVLLHNSLDFRARVRKANSNALAMATFLTSRDSIANVNYPTMVPSRSLYERYRRPDGGYGSLISFVFREAETAVRFYDVVHLCKGPSFGANFTLVLPYSQIAHASELDWAESQGVAKHIIRISVGLEDESVLMGKLGLALKEAETPPIHTSST